jgi:hypothetical protein
LAAIKCPSSWMITKNIKSAIQMMIQNIEYIIWINHDTTVSICSYLARANKKNYRVAIVLFIAVCLFV